MTDETTVCADDTSQLAPPVGRTLPPNTSRSIEWFHEGQSRIVEVDGVQVTIRLVGRRGRRARIAITAPGGAEFRTVDAVDR